MLHACNHQQQNHHIPEPFAQKPRFFFTFKNANGFKTFRLSTSDVSFLQIQRLNSVRHATFANQSQRERMEPRRLPQAQKVLEPPEFDPAPSSSFGQTRIALLILIGANNKICRKFAESKHHVYLFLYHLWNNQVGIKLSDHLVGSQKSFDHMSLSGAFPHMSPRFVLQFLVNFTLRGRHRGEDLVLKLLGSILGTWGVSGVVLGRWGLAHWSSTFKFNYIHMKKNNGWMVDKSTVSDFANEPKPLWEKNISEKHWNLTKKTSKFVIWCRIIWQVSVRPKTWWKPVGFQLLEHNVIWPKKNNDTDVPDPM